VLSSIVLHLAAGAITGFIFSIRILLFALLLLLIEGIMLSVAFGVSFVVGPVIGIVALQIGYLSGGYARTVVERLAGSRQTAKAPRLR